MIVGVQYRDDYHCKGSGMENVLTEQVFSLQLMALICNWDVFVEVG